MKKIANPARLLCAAATVSFATGCTRTLPDATLVADTEVVTRVAVHLENDEEITAHLEYGDASEPEETWLRSDDVVGSTLDFTAYLHADTTSGIRVVGTDANGRKVAGAVQEITVGSIPNEIPVYQSTIDVTVEGLGPLLLTTEMSADADETVANILTLDGRSVWYWQPGDGVLPAARYDAASGDVYGVVSQIADDGYGYVFRVPVAGGEVQKHELTWAHHDALLLDDGVIATLVSTFGEYEGDTVAGDSIVEIDPDGTERTIWDAFDVLAPAPNHAWSITQFPGGEKDWTHANGLDYDPGEGAYYVSLWGTEQVIKVDRATGNTVWIMGGPENEFDFGDDGGFGPQHAPDFEGGRLTLFDNNDASGSRACDYAVDEDARTATLTWSYAPADPLWALVLGDVTARDGGSHLMGWGSSGNIYVTDADDQLAGFLQMDKALAIGQVTEIGTLP